MLILPVLGVLPLKIIRWKCDRLQSMRTMIADGSTSRHWTQTVERNMNDSGNKRQHNTGHEFSSAQNSLLDGFCSYKWPTSLFDTHSDPDESPSTVPALMLMATPLRWSGMLGLARPTRPSLEDDPCGDAVSSVCSHSSLWMRLRQFLSTIGDSCFFFNIPAVDKNKVWCLYINLRLQNQTVG